jgi:RNA polymerase-binding protein DksA
MTNALTPEQLEELRSTLQSMREQLMQTAEEELQEARKQPFKKLAGDVHDKGDESIAEQVAGLNAGLADLRTNELHAAEAAFARIEEGSYGICVDCGGEIGYERLRAYPVTRRCIVCKQRYENEHAGPGRPPTL